MSSSESSNLFGTFLGETWETQVSKQKVTWHDDVIFYCQTGPVACFFTAMLLFLKRSTNMSKLTGRVLQSCHCQLNHPMYIDPWLKNSENMVLTLGVYQSLPVQQQNFRVTAVVKRSPVHFTTIWVGFWHFTTFYLLKVDPRPWFHGPYGWSLFYMVPWSMV